MKKHRRVIPVVVLSLAGFLPFHASPVEAAQETLCVADGELTLSPGLSTTPSSGTFTTGGLTGTTTCTGPVNGHEPVGLGIRGEDGHYGVGAPSTCDSGTQGIYTITFKVPTPGGIQVVTDTGTFTAGGLQNGFFTGTFQGERMRGTLQLMPLEGNCVTAPITRLRFHCEEWVIEKD